MSYTVFIPTAGIGSRLKNYSRYLNKSLIEVENLPTISRQILSFPNNCEFIIALGYKGNLVKDYLKLAHPEKNIKFVKIPIFQGKNSAWV